MKYAVVWFEFANNSTHVAGPFADKETATEYAAKLLDAGDVLVAVRELTKP